MKLVLVLCSIMCIFTGKPILRYIHGFGSNCWFEGEFFDNFKNFDFKCIETGLGFITPFETQIKTACDQLLKEKDLLSKGFAMIGTSQGGLIARAVLQRCEVGKYVKRLITIGGPHNGVATIPRISPTSFINFLIRVCYTSLGKAHIGPCGYVRTLKYKEYFTSDNSILDLNNEVQTNPQYKERIQNLDLFMAIGFNDDTMIQPKNTSTFGFFKDNEYKTYSPMEEQKIYKEDRIGLKKLENEQKLFRCSVPGDHLQLGYEYTILLVKDFSDITSYDYKNNFKDMKDICLFKGN